MKKLEGISGASGMAICPLFFYEADANDMDCPKEKIDLDVAIAKCIQKMELLYAKALEEIGEEEAKIFEAYKMLLEDNYMFEPIRKSIQNGKDICESVMEETEKNYQIFQSMENPYMKQRGDDMKYIAKIIIDTIEGKDQKIELPNDSEKIIIVAKDLSPVETMAMDKNKLAGIVTELGGSTSHTVILAKSLGIPAIVGAVNALNEKAEYNGKIGILTGDEGFLYLEPDKETMEIYQKKEEEKASFNEIINCFGNKNAVTKDGQEKEVLLNIGRYEDLKTVNKQVSFDGVGLFRTEFLYLEATKMPTFEQQKKVYEKVIEEISPNVVTIRTLDIGGDKEVPYMDLPKEENPFLGNRGIRLCLTYEELFCQQLKAILMAAGEREVKIMLPMVTGVEEIRKTKELLQKIRNEIGNDNVGSKAKLGVMIETPAAAIMADKLAKECDFFSIGTNDLTQYITASDRGNTAIQYVYNPYNPAVISMISHTIEEGRKAGIDVSICGDLASDLSYISLLVGMGLEKYSVPGSMIGKVKFQLNQIDQKEAQILLNRVMKMSDVDSIKKEVIYFNKKIQ